MSMLDSLKQDADAWALNFCRDFRSLHQFNHNHDCTSTCIKYVKKGKDAVEKALRKGWSVACRFFFFHIVTFTYLCSVTGSMITKSFRRRGKKLVPEAYVALTNDHGELFRVVVRRQNPFRSASSDVGQVWSRSNNDFQFMPRTFVLSRNETSGAEEPAVEPKLALAMYGIRLRLPDEPM